MDRLDFGSNFLGWRKYLHDEAYMGLVLVVNYKHGLVSHAQAKLGGSLEFSSQFKISSKMETWNRV
jgi:hypothetical protein